MGGLGLIVSTLVVFTWGCTSPQPGSEAPDILPTTLFAAPNHVAHDTFTRSTVAPPPISGGTLRISADGRLAVVAESDRDLVHIVDLEIDEVLTTIELEPGDEPGRVAALDGDYVVVLRGSGDLVRIDGASWTVKQRVHVCASPRGADFDAEQGALWVTCLDGSFISLDAALRELSRTSLANDLRDVVVTETALFVSRFRSADVLILDRNNGALLRTVPGLMFESPCRSIRQESQSRLANVAYRMVRSGPDEVMMVHQLSATHIPSTEHGGGMPSVGRAAYGAGGGGCGGTVVQTGVTVLTPHSDGATTRHGELPLPVDIALRGTGEVAIASAGARWDGRGTRTAPPVGFTFESALRSGSDDSDFIAANNTGRFGRLAVRSASVAIGYSNGLLVRQTQSPHRVVVEGRAPIELPGPDTYDLGYDLFFGDAGQGIACASCHAEGGEDGIVWQFEGIGPRRTQDIRGGILDSAPFHWAGDMETLEHLTAEVMTGRMGGPPMSPEWNAALGHYMDSMNLPARPAPEDPEAVKRGHVVFDRADVGCRGCHSNARYTRQGSFDVGTRLFAQVPALIGLSLRAPYMHDGCAETIADRFSLDCGGARHGNTDHLSEAELADLVAFLESL